MAPIANTIADEIAVRRHCGAATQPYRSTAERQLGSVTAWLQRIMAQPRPRAVRQPRRSIAFVQLTNFREGRDKEEPQSGIRELQQREEYARRPRMNVIDSRLRGNDSL